MFQIGDFATIGVIVLLEGILSIDNALALALLAKPLPARLQRKALTYGLVGAVVFRLAALAFAGFLMQWQWVKFVGGGYLLYLGLSHFLRGGSEEKAKQKTKNAQMNFWKTVLLIEMTDIAFALDSILAAVAISNKLWVVFLGGIMGLILMRFAASIFISLLKKFPNFEGTAYFLVIVVGAKLFIDGFQIPGVNFHSSASPATWIFWGFIFFGIMYGFKPRRKAEVQETLKTMKKEAETVEAIEQNS